MQRILVLCVVAALTVPLAGCILVTKKPRGTRAVAREQCHPSQYWDGDQCRHKGKGKGARKHDGR